MKNKIKITQRIQDYKISVITDEEYKIFIKDFEKLSFTKIFTLQNTYYNTILNSEKAKNITIPIIEEFIKNTKATITHHSGMEHASYREKDDSIVVMQSNTKDSARYYLTVCESLINWVINPKRFNTSKYNYNDICALSKFLVQRFGAVMLLAHFGFRLRAVITSNQFDMYNSSNLKLDLCNSPPNSYFSVNIKNYINDCEMQEIFLFTVEAVNYLLDLTNLKNYCVAK